ncbi:ribonuclease T2 [Myotis yumanensis]|uniref:ribonuclease T2 n=1 Tax=Myotis yumanensis TaxID=159337 RepID=UPI0038D1583C
MKPAAPGRALLCALGLAFCLSCAHGLRSSGSHEWKKLIMVHHWPATVCKRAEDGCRDPPDYWTIHGLWADKADSCNRSWPFKLDEIKDLMQDMKMYWPDLLHSSPNSTFLW